MRRSHIKSSCLSVEAASRLENVAFLNLSTDGFSCEVKMNLELTVGFLCKEKNQVSLPDPNHDNKNTRFNWLVAQDLQVL